ncbi:hypothetical protein GOBAR_DD05410 [Gossypium barbadense]|nr:hypothetical protein GOBAR_DD05410 [Gossypium barbadense]
MDDEDIQTMIWIHIWFGLMNAAKLYVKLVKVVKEEGADMGVLLSSSSGHNVYNLRFLNQYYQGLRFREGLREEFEEDKAPNVQHEDFNDPKDEEMPREGVDPDTTHANEFPEYPDIIPSLIVQLNEGLEELQMGLKFPNKKLAFLPLSVIA